MKQPRRIDKQIRPIVIPSNLVRGGVDNPGQTPMKDHVENPSNTPLKG